MVGKEWNKNRKGLNKRERERQERAFAAYICYDYESQKKRPNYRCKHYLTKKSKLKVWNIWCAPSFYMIRVCTSLGLFCQGPFNGQNRKLDRTSSYITTNDINLYSQHWDFEVDWFPGWFVFKQKKLFKWSKHKIQEHHIKIRLEPNSQIFSS